MQNKINKLFTKPEETLLKTLIGKTLIKIRHDRFDYSTVSFLRVTFFFENGEVYELENSTEPTDFMWDDYGEEDVAVFKIHKTEDKGINYNYGFDNYPSQIEMPINETIKDIVVIEDNVEIGANTCVDRSTMGQTIIHKGVKLDNLIQVAHNCEVGENTVMSAQVGMAGSTKIGQWCMVGGQAGFAGHIHVADKTFVGAQCGVISNTKGNEQLIGSPAMEPKTFFKGMAILKHLPEMYRDLAALKRKVDNQ